MFGFKFNVTPVRVLLLAVLLLGFGLRLYLAFQTQVGYSDDSHWYMTLAQNLVSGKGYTLFGQEHDRYPPGFPLTIIAFSAIFPNYEDAGKYASVLFGSLSIFLVFLLGRKMFGSRAGVFAAAIFAFLPLAVQYSFLQLSDAGYLFFYLLALIFFFKALDKLDWNFFLFFFFAGIATLFRTTGLVDFFPPLVLISAWLFFFDRSKFDSVVSHAPFALVGFLLSYGPFVLRNLLVFGAPLGAGYVADQQKSTGVIYLQYLPDIALQITIPVAILFLASLFFVNWKDDKFKFFALFSIIHVVFHFFWWGYDIRLMLNALPFFLIFAGFGLASLLEKSGRPSSNVFLLACGVFLINPIAATAFGFNDMILSGNHLLPLKQTALFLNQTMKQGDVAIVGDVNIYGFQMQGKNIIDARQFPAFPGSLQGLVQANADYLAFDSGVSYSYSGRFDFLSGGNFSVSKDLSSPVEFDIQLQDGKYHFRFSPIKRFVNGLTFAQAYAVQYFKTG